MDFGIPLGPTLDSFWRLFRNLSVDSRVVFLVIWEGTWHQDAMPGCAENAINIVVFVRFAVLEKLEF